MAKDDGGKAFPTQHGWGLMPKDCKGMTLRDYFAGQALAGFPWKDYQFKKSKEPLSVNIAAYSYNIADDMIKERNKDVK